MKKQLLTTLCAAMILTACGQKPQTEQGAATETKAETSVNDYDHLNPSQDDGTQTKAEDLSGKVIALTSEEFLAQITDLDPNKGLRYKGNTPCMVDFYADWCRPCMQLKPITERMAEKYKGKFIIYKINVDRAQDICQTLGIQNIPTLIFFKPNTQPAKMVGAPSEDELEQAIQDFLK